MNPLSTYITFVKDVETVLASNLDDALKLRSIAILIRGLRSDDILEDATGQGRR